MKIPTRRSVFLSIRASLVCGVALAAYEINELHRAMTVSRQIAEAIATGLGGGDEWR